MSGYPQWVRTEPGFGPIVSGAPVSAAQTWAMAGAGANWLNGTGAQLVPACSMKQSLSALSGAGTFHFRTYTRSQAIARVWAIQITGTVADASIATIQAGSGATLTVSVPAIGVVNMPFLYTEPLAAQAAALTDLSITITNTDKGIQVVSIACWEQWRPVLAEGSDDHGVNAQSIRPRARVYVGNYPTAAESATGVRSAMLAADARRVGLFHYSVPTVAPITRTGAYQSILGLPMPILGRLVTSGQTKAQVYWAAYCKMSAGNGDVQITTTGGGTPSDSVNVTGAAYAWTTARAIYVDCEDMSTADGRRGGAWDVIDVNIRGNGGNTLSLAAFSVWEQP